MFDARVGRIRVIRFTQAGSAVPLSVRTFMHSSQTNLKLANHHRSVSVVTVCLNAQDQLQKTIDSVHAQDHRPVEYLVIDGGSTDGTLAIISANSSKLHFWQSVPDLGVYYAMNDALINCSGEWILFMNAGDTFSSPDSLSRLFRAVPDDADVVYGDHLYVHKGVEEYHAAADFELTWGRLRSGTLGFDWLAGIPGHQATAVRTALLEKLKFDTTFRIAADHDLLFRARKGGAKFFYCAELVSVYVGGGFSAKNYDLCKKEWLQIAETYGDAANARKFYAQLDEVEARAGRYEDAKDRPSQLRARVRGLAKGLKRLARIRH
jgi:glycosyltransferase involved in cell wall biosynthesis